MTKMTQKEYQYIVEKQFTPKQVAMIFSALGFEVKSCLAWLNLWKNYSKTFQPAGQKTRKVNPRTKKSDPKMALYTFVDVCLIVWVRSVSSGNVINSKSKPGGLSLRRTDILEFAPVVKRSIRAVSKNRTKKVKSNKGRDPRFLQRYPAEDCPWNSVTFDFEFLVEDVAKAILKLKKQAPYIRGVEW